MKILTRFVLLAALAPAAYSQSVLYNFYGDSDADVFGRSVSGAGDVNGDGYADMIVGAPRDDNNGDRSGSARVLSGVDGSVLYSFDGDSAEDRFGFSVSGAGDVDKDGYDDLIVGALFGKKNGTPDGSARVFSGLDGSILYTFYGDSKLDVFGVSVSGAGDVNGDGFADLIVGADQHFATGPGYARVLSGLDGSIIHTFDGDSPGDSFGISVSGAGDVNGDGYADLIVGTPDDDNNGYDSGSARVFSGLDGSVLYSFEGDSAGDHFGHSVSGAGDVNGDGYPDLIVGAYGDDNIANLSGSARVFSGVDGSVLYTFDGDALGPANDCLGWTVSGAGDVNGDGFDDMIVGASCAGGPGGEYARVFSGAEGSILYTFYWEQWKTNFASSVSGAGDVNGDGFDDLVVGNFHYENNGARTGLARVFSGWSPVGTNYCGPAVPNSSGLPAAILALGSDTATDNILWLRATDMPQNKFGYFLAGQTQGFIPNPAGSQGNLCLSGKIGRFAMQVQKSGPGGNFTIQVDLTSIPPNPPHTVLAGETWNFQAWFRDNNPGNTSNFTDGISVTFN